MGTFIYDSPVFQRELQNQAHPAGEIRFLKSIAKPGMRVIDTGANRGVTTVAIARQVGSGGHVYAFEPVPETQAAFEQLYARIEESLLAGSNIARGGGDRAHL